MKGLTFDTFIPHKSNHAAFDACKNVARLKPDLPRPVVLLGESGAGKSHLLWSIVNHYRNRNIKVGVALISPKDFPDPVKDLADNASKLQEGTPIVLLVDDLHLFEKNAPALEKTIFSLIEHGHTAVLATRIHPNVLPMYSGKFKALLNSGIVIGIKALPKSEGAAIPEAAVQQILALKSRISELKRDKAALQAEKNRIPQESISSQSSDAADMAPQPEQRFVYEQVNDAVKQDESSLQERLNETLLQRDQARDEAEAWKNALVGIMNRVETFKSMQDVQFSTIEEQISHLLSFAENSFTSLDQEILDSATEEISELMGERDTGIFEPPSEDARQTLSAIAEQFKSLDETTPSDSSFSDQ